MTKPPQPEPPALAATTTMFVEVLVIGIGTLTAGVLLLIALVGPHATTTLAPLAGSTLAAGAALAAAYALGILTDRIADTALAPVRRRLRAQSFPPGGTYAQARLRLAEIPSLAARADYARSRMRICRGWLFNCIALTLTVDLAMLRFSFDHRLFLMGASTLLGSLTAFGFYRAWYTLTATGYRKLALQTTPTTSSAPPQAPTSPTAP